MKEMFLLGAGASVEAGIPDSYDMTKRILKEFETRSKRHAKIISFVVGGLLFQNGIRGSNPLEIGVNVEELFNAIDLLANRHTLEAAPFVGSWHSMIDKIDKIDPPRSDIQGVYRAIYQSVTKEILHALPNHAPHFGGHDIDNALVHAISQAKNSPNYISSSMFSEVSRAIGKYVIEITNEWLRNLDRFPTSSMAFEREFENATNRISKPGEGKIFNALAEHMIRSLANIVWIDNPSKVSYLQPLLNSLKNQNKLTIATLNYDNSLELLAEENHVHCSTGIERWSSSGKFEEINDGILLLKLHGSIDWALKSGKCDESRPLPYNVIERVPAEQIKKTGFRPAVIFGHRNKLTAEGPFLDLLRVFQHELNIANKLTVIGYSFGDEHINVYLSNWINQDKDHKLKIINPKFQNIPNDFTIHLKGVSKDRVEIIEEDASKGLQKLSTLFDK